MTKYILTSVFLGLLTFVFFKAEPIALEQYEYNIHEDKIEKQAKENRTPILEFAASLAPLLDSVPKDGVDLAIRSITERP